MKFLKQSLNNIPIEDAHNGSGSRQMLVKPQDIESAFLEAVTKGFLPTGSIFDWHSHENIDEIFIVTRGEGNFYCENEETNYTSGDVLTVGANLRHKIEATGDKTTEGFFIRVKSK